VTSIDYKLGLNFLEVFFILLQRCILVAENKNLLYTQVNMTTLTKEIINKFNIEGPRYTSYPTAPVWTKDYTHSSYILTLKRLASEKKPLSLYLHIPFCEKRCYFCACNVVIKKQNVKFGDTYLDYLEKEIAMVTSILGEGYPVKQIHIGGGTPTYLSDVQLTRLGNMLSDAFNLDDIYEQSIEVDPRSVDPARLDFIRTLGFNRISFGIQDMNPKVQDAINRHHTLEEIDMLMYAAKELKFLSVNCDLIYGLPFQSRNDFKHTVDQIISLKPDRIALYSFALVPWLHSHQKLISEDSLPDADTKLDLFLQSREQFLESGYTSIAMDHFALATDDLATAFDKGTLYRNFMGYTTLATDDYLGLGVSSIGYAGNSFIQNTKDLKEYYALIDSGVLPTERGYSLSEDDLMRQWIIHHLMCSFKIDKIQFQTQFNVAFDESFSDCATHLKQCEVDGLLLIQGNDIVVTDLGKLFVRNIAMGFDAYFDSQKKVQQFSKTV
jgi:oxygen-independent coproporphyrinogen III oxidase